MRWSNMVRLLWGASVFGLIFWGIAACTRPSTEQGGIFSSPVTPVYESPLLPTATLLPLALETNCGGARGVIVTYPTSWIGSELYVYFAPFSPGERADEGIFVLEPSIHPSTQIGPEGSFQLGNIPPGKYVVVVGPNPQESIPIRRGNRPYIFEILEGEILEIGEVHLED